MTAARFDEGASPPDPQRLRRWRTLTIALLIAGYSGYYLCRSNLSVATPLLKKDLAARGLDLADAGVWIGTVASLGTLVYALGKFLAGALGDVMGGRRNFLGGMAGSVVFTLVLAFAGVSPFFTIAWIGNRAVQSMGWAGMVKITSRWFDFTSHGTVMAVLSLSYLFGDAVARGFMGLLLNQGMGWRGLFVTCAAILAGLFSVCLFLLRESPSEIGVREGAAHPLNVYGAAGGEARPASFAQLVGPLVHNRAFQYVCALSLTTSLLRETFNTWSPTYFTEFVHLTPEKAAAVSALFPFVGGISVLLAGVAGDRLGHAGRATILLAGLIATGVALWSLGSLPPDVAPAWPIGLVTLVGFLLIGPYSYLGGAIALDFGGKHGSATASGVIDGSGYLAGVLAGDGIARLVRGLGWGSTFSVLAVAAWVTSIVAALLLFEQRRTAQRHGAAQPTDLVAQTGST